MQCQFLPEVLDPNRACGEVLRGIQEVAELCWVTLTPEEQETLVKTRVITTTLEVAVA